MSQIQASHYQIPSDTILAPAVNWRMLGRGQLVGMCQDFTCAGSEALFRWVVHWVGLCIIYLYHSRVIHLDQHIADWVSTLGDGAADLAVCLEVVQSSRLACCCSVYLDLLPASSFKQEGLQSVMQWLKNK